MNENDIDSKIKDFSNYLLDIGLLIGSSYNEFGKKFKEINEKEKILLDDEEVYENYDLTFFKDNISKTMIKFFDSMNEEKKKLITFNIFNTYTKKKEEKNKGDFNINKNEIINENEEDISENKEDIEYKEEHFEIFIGPTKILKLFDEKSEEDSKETFNNLLIKKKKQKKENNFKKKNIPRKKEQKINLNENCTFQPNVDKKGKKGEKKEKRNISEIFNKLYKRSEKREKDVENMRKEIEKDSVFQPNLETNRGKSKKDINRKNFDKRLKLFEENRKDKEKNRKREEEKEFNNKFPFVPNKEKERNNSYNKSFNKSFNKKRNESFSSESIYQRLHDDNKKMKKKYEENVKKVIEDIKDRANHPIVKHNNINYITKRKWYEEPERKIFNIKNMSFDKKDKILHTEEKKEDVKLFTNKRIEELYEEYKRMKNDFKDEMNQINDYDSNYNKTNVEEIINEKMDKNSKEENNEKINFSSINNEIDNNIENKNEKRDNDLENKNVDNS